MTGREREMIFSGSTASSSSETKPGWRSKHPTLLYPSLALPSSLTLPRQRGQNEGETRRARETDKQSKGESSEQAKHASGGGSKGFGSLGCQFASLMKASGRDTTPIQVSQEISSSSSSPLRLHTIYGELFYGFTWLKNMTTVLQHRRFWMFVLRRKQEQKKNQICISQEIPVAKKKVSVV